MAENENNSSLKLLIEKDMEVLLGKPIKTKRFWTWLTADFFLIQLIIGPFTVLVWWGGWHLYEYFFLWIANRFFGSEDEEIPDHDERALFSGIVTLIAGVITSVPIAMFYKEFEIYSSKVAGHVVRYFILSRIFSVIRFLTTLLYWIGTFQVLDYLSPRSVVSLLAVCISSAVLLGIGCFKTAAVTPPLGVWLDTSEKFVCIDTYLETEQTDPLSSRLLDGVLTTMIEVLATIW